MPLIEFKESEDALDAQPNPAPEQQVTQQAFSYFREGDEPSPSKTIESKKTDENSYS